MSCANQIVQVPKNHYNQMKLLIVAEYGTYAGEFSFMKDKSKGTASGLRQMSG